MDQIYEVMLTVLPSFLDKIVFPFTGAVILALTGWIVNKIAKKYDLDILRQNQEIIRQTVARGVYMAEEWADKKLKETGKKPSSNDKLQKAVNHAVQSIPNLSPERAAEYAEAFLAQIPGWGASGEKVP